LSRSGMVLERSVFWRKGMVAKKIDSVYVSGRSSDWLKTKTEVGRIEMEGRSERWRC
jgi:hypothetical protein